MIVRIAFAGHSPASHNQESVQHCTSDFCHGRDMHEDWCRLWEGVHGTGSECCAASIGRQRYRMTGGTGSYLFMAPEVFRHQSYNAQADVYSLAMVMYEMLAGCRPFVDMDPCLAAMHAATDDMRPDWPAQLPACYGPAEQALWRQVQALVETCWSPSASARYASDITGASHHVASVCSSPSRCLRCFGLPFAMGE